MAIEILLPRLGWTMEEGVFVEWLKRDGDAVQSGDLLFTIESDKATDEVETFESGILRIAPDGPQPGSTLPVGAVLGYLVQPGERAPFEAENQEPRTENRRTGEPENRETRLDNGHPTPNSQLPTPNSQSPIPNSRPPTPNSRRSGPTISPRARRIAAELGIDWAAVTGSGRTGRIVERDIRALAAQAPTGQVRATPLARRMAEDLGVDLGQLAASQPGRRIDRSEVEQAARARTPAVVPLAAPVQTQPLSGIRRITAARMAESAHTAAPVTLTTEADATELARLRSNIVADMAGTDLAAPSYNDLLVRLVALALLEHPALNASLENDRIVQHAAVHIGIAVDTERGLLAPVVRDAHIKSVQQIASASNQLIAQARAGKSGPDDLSGGTFTITNLGMYEIDAFTPIINLPECAILGVGRIVARPVVIDEQAETVAVRKMMALSLSFDHRVVDGAPAARFLQRVKHYVEHPYSWLTR
jgi:pyruvate dehydrogenase E2 component (dihydrolipoyllysine-residue acetyltransferase)